MDVAYPGTYRMGFTFTSGGHTFRLYEAKSSSNKLARGRQSLTLSFRSDSLWSQLRDGPLVVGDLSLVYGDVGYTVKVPNTDIQARTAALKREQWYPGMVFGDDAVSLQGIQRATSGRFRFAEVRWGVTTAGGQCSWSGTLRSQPGSRPDVRYFGSLPAGRSALSFIFDGPLAAAPDKHDWSFVGGIQCGPNQARVDCQNLAVDPAQYQPALASFPIQVVNPIRIAAGGSVTVPLGVQNAREEVKFRLDNVPKGLTARLDLPTRRADYVQAHATVEVLANTKPGRYVIEIAVEAETETARTEMLVDVVAK